MAASADPVAKALQASSRSEVAELLRDCRRFLNRPELIRLTQHLESLAEPRRPLKLAIARTYTTELLRPYWTFEALLHGYALDLYEAPYGSLLPETQPGSHLLEHAPDATYLFLRWEDLEPRLSEPLTSRSTQEREAVREAALRQLVTLVAGFRGALSGLIVVTLLPRLTGCELGLHDAMAAASEGAFRSELKRELAARLRADLPGVHFDDLDTLTEEIGRRAMFDARLWYSARFPFSAAGAQTLVRRLLGYAIVLTEPRAKCLVIDADNTLWGGIVGEEGLDGIALGPEYPGAAYVAFQRRLLDFQQRGFLLALCSKNEERDVLDVLRHHPHQLLRESHFAAMRVNWLAKPDNLRAIAAELHLGLDSLLFVDDSAHECLAVQQELPAVTVVRTPAEPAELPACLDHVARLEILSLTDEDRDRTALYARERQRRTLADASGDLERYVASLNMVMTVGIDDARAATRIAQLTQKTNQFNLTSRRYSEADVRALMMDPDWLVAHFSLVDVFGDSGLVGVAVLKLEGMAAEFDSFLMSCRVIGRRAETAFLGYLLARLSARGVRLVRGRFVASPRNALVEHFWPEHGFAVESAGTYCFESTARAASLKRFDVPIRVQEIESSGRDGSIRNAS